MAPPDPSSTSALLAESAWLHRLALRLVAEPAGADDATQEALTTALARPPAPGVPLRRWLATVLRNVVRQERRASGRRQAREHLRPAASTSEPTDELAARLELHGELLLAVRALAEPYRTTIALRFLEDLPVRAVAERMGVPEKTVYSRLERALAELRARLDRAHGARGAWAAILVPALARELSPGALSLAGSGTLAPLIAMSTLWKWAGACAAVAAFGILAVRSLPTRAGHHEPAQLEIGEELTARLDEPPRPNLEPRPPVPERVERSTVASEPTQVEPPLAPASAPRFGFVRDLQRRPVAGLEVTLESMKSVPDGSEESAPLAPAVRSDAEGRFELATTDSWCHVVARGRGYATVIAPALVGTSVPEPPVVYVGPERSYAGQVVDEEGAPVAGAELGIYLANELLHELTPGTLFGLLPLARGDSDADGRFEFPSVGGAPGSHLNVSATGYQTTKLELPPDSSAALVVVLRRTERVERALAGVVENEDGSPAVGAYVSSGKISVRTDASGAFQLALEAGEQPQLVRAILAGRLPAELSLQGLPESRWRELVLVLGGEPLAIRGRVLDRDGNAIAGAHVWTEDGQHFGSVMTELENVQFSMDYDAEGLMAGVDGNQAGGRQTHADAQGQFALTGLVARRYGLLVLDPRTSELAGPFDVGAGAAAVELRLPGEPTKRVAGRVVSYSGEPVAGVNVHVTRLRRGNDGNLRSHRSDPNQTLQTDAEGRFVFEALCVENTRLDVSSNDAPIEIPFELALEPDLEHLEFAFPATCHLRVHLDDPERASSLSLRDADDQPLDLTFNLGTILCSSQSVRIERGISDLLTTDERAQTLVLYRDALESERIPLRLVPGGVNDVRP